MPLRNTIFVSQILLHAPGAGVSSSSDTERASAIKESLTTITNHPFGSGPGTAGPAVLRSQNTGVLTENYYLQLGVEVGIIGLALFLAILSGVALALWRQTGESTLALALFASLIGISAINLVLHGWADSTIALLWWGATGAIVRQRK